MIWPVSLFQGARDAIPKPAQWGWPGLVHALTVARVEPNKLESPAWSPALYNKGARRGAVGVQSVSCLVLDYDDGMTIEEAAQLWRGLRAIAHTSWSHTTEAPRFRYILPLLEPISGKHWSAVWREMWKQSGGADKSCSDPSRLYFLPSVRRGGWPFTGEVLYPTAPFLDLAEVEVQAKRKRPPRRPMKRLSVSARPRARRDRLMEPGARQAVGVELGGVIAGIGADARIVGVVCPQCGRADVWFPIEPRGKGAASCNHRNTCGWWGWLEDLWSAHG